MECYLHIGVGKTGTTAIQHYSSLAYDYLISIGMLYPKSLRMDIGDNGGFYRELMAPVRFIIDGRNHSAEVDDWFVRNAFRSTLEAETRIIYLLRKEIAEKKASRIIISEEHFSLPRNYHKRVKEFIERAGFNEIKVIIYVRRQDELMDSLSNQWIKNNKQVEKVAEVPDYFHIINDYAKCYGERNIILRPFEKNHLVNKNVIDDFYSQLGAYNITNEFKMPKGLIKNESIYNPDVIEIKRMLNKGLNVDDRYLHAALNALLKVPSISEGTYTHFASLTERLTYIRQFEKKNQNLAKRFLNRKTLFQSPVNDIKPYEDMTIERLVPFLIDLHMQQQKKIDELQSRTDKLEQSLATQKEYSILER